MRREESTHTSRLKALFATEPDPYRDFDAAASRTWGAALLLLQSALIVGLSPLAPPTDHTGDAAGWGLLAGIVLAQLGCAWLLGTCVLGLVSSRNEGIGEGPDVLNVPAGEVGSVPLMLIVSVDVSVTFCTRSLPRSTT